MSHIARQEQDRAITLAQNKSRVRVLKWFKCFQDSRGNAEDDTCLCRSSTPEMVI